MTCDRWLFVTRWIWMPFLSYISVVQTHESHSGKKINASPAENNSPFFLSQTGSYDPCVRGKLNLFLLLFLVCVCEREDNGCLALFLSSLQTVIFTFPCLCYKAINNTSKRDYGHQKEEITGTDMAETISVTSVHRCSSLSSFSNKNSTEKHSVCAPQPRWELAILNVLKRLLISCL